MELLERIVIRFTYFTTSTNLNFQVLDSASNPPPFETIFDTSVPFVAELAIESALLSMTGTYNLLLGSQLVAQFSIIVNSELMSLK